MSVRDDFCNCEEPEIDALSGPYEHWCEFCKRSIPIRASSATYVSPKHAWYIVGVHTWGGGGLYLPLYLAALYYAFIYPLFTFGVVILSANDWWEGLFKGKRK